MKALSHRHSINLQHPLQGSARYKSLSTAVNTSLTPQTFDGISYISSKYPEGDIRDAVGTKPSIGTGFTLPKSSSVYTNKLEYLIDDCLTERGPILIDVPTGRNELVMAAHSTQSIPKLYPIVGLHEELPGIALPSPIPLDLPEVER